jgi:hypothetical protein
MVERKKERELILSGKMQMSESHWKDDPVLKLHRDLDKVQRKVSKGQQQQQLQQQRRIKKSSLSTTPSASSVSASTGVKMKWISAMSKLHIRSVYDLKQA